MAQATGPLAKSAPGDSVAVMNSNTQSRRDTKCFVSLVVASVVGLSMVGCSSERPTTTGSSTEGVRGAGEGG